MIQILLPILLYKITQFNICNLFITLIIKKDVKKSLKKKKKKNETSVRMQNINFPKKKHHVL